MGTENMMRIQQSFMNMMISVIFLAIAEKGERNILQQILQDYETIKQ
jgi:hypothetical protein